MQKNIVVITEKSAFRIKRAFPVPSSEHGDSKWHLRRGSHLEQKSFEHSRVEEMGDLSLTTFLAILDECRGES